MKLRLGFIAFVILACLTAQAQHQSDPLTTAEIDQLRDAALEPEQRLKLYVEFARARLVSLEQMRSDPKTTDRAHKTHTLLEDFLTIYDELNDNIDNFVARKDDLRKPLKLIIEGDTDFQAKLRALKDSASAKPAEAKEYEFTLSNAIETVDNAVVDHRQLLTDQEEAAKQKKKH
jgi:hypothetical protein